MTHENKVDENSRLINTTIEQEEEEAHYGSTINDPVTTQSTNTSISSFISHSEEVYSDHDSSEEARSVSVAKRKKKRLQKHHRPPRPKLVSTLSHIVRSARQSEDEDDTDDVIEMPVNHLIIPELDPTAEEVREYIPSPRACVESNWLPRKHKVNLSTIREKYRDSRIHERIGIIPLTRLEKIKNLFKYEAYVSEAKRVLFANQSIILFVYVDLLVDLLLCLAYLVEMKQEADIHATPPWMYKWRSYDLW
ncbi:hypothetical protein HPULCUR_001859 [Helicostylum pulchrum]|uniref:Uncharacterized protein n=1 Tax=Helicostylum pulchrum TaxID=562976 RepID=A0ABP9XNZ4_9FUNG